MSKLGDLLSGKGSALDLVRHQCELLEQEMMRAYTEELKTRAKIVLRDELIDRKAAIAATKAKKAKK